MSERPSEQESRLIELLRSIDEPAPERLHRRVAELAGAAPNARRGLRSPLGMRLGLAGGGLLAGGAAALVLALSGPGPNPLTLEHETALTLRQATLAAPAENMSARAQLTASVDGVPFPYWGERFGWRASGARHDTLGGRTVQTVFYTSPAGARIGYAIVSGTPAPDVSGGTVRWRGGTPYRVVDVGGVPVVTWVRGGRRCVVSGRGVGTGQLLRLASWDDRARA
jgi:hypothetical protein